MRTRVMGVVNVTPDSFSDGGRFASPEAAIVHGKALAKAGAHVLDIGGESTRPGANPVSAELERARVVPVVEGLLPFGQLSIDTTKAEVASAAVAVGATWINDISGLRFDPEVADVAAESGACLILGHIRGRPSSMQEGEMRYEGGVVEAVRSGLMESMELALRRGVHPSRLLVDPGIGFGKTTEQNLALLHAIPRLSQLAPVLIGTSRKRFLGEMTGRAVHERDAATLSTVVWAVERGVSMVRVHEVSGTVDAIKVTEAIMAAES